jgi:hypothetical protein
MPRSRAVSGRVLLVPQVFAIHSNGAEHGYNAFMTLRALAAAHRSIRNWLSLTANFATIKNIRASGRPQRNPPRWPHCDEGLAAEVVKSGSFAIPLGVAQSSRRSASGSENGNSGVRRYRERPLRGDGAPMRRFVVSGAQQARTPRHRRSPGVSVLDRQSQLSFHPALFGEWWTI